MQTTAMRPIRRLSIWTLVAVALAIVLSLIAGSSDSGQQSALPTDASISSLVSDDAATVEVDTVAFSAPMVVPSNCTDKETVKPGQVLSKMSAAHGRKDWQNVNRENGRGDANVLKIDEEICFKWSGSAPNPAPAAPQAAAPAPASNDTYTGRVKVSEWDRVAFFESTNRWDCNTGNGHYGGLQFKTATWLMYGGGEFAPRADKATKNQQMTVAMRVLTGYEDVAPQGWRAWEVITKTDLQSRYPEYNDRKA